MWHKLIIVLFFLVLAKTANALPISEPDVINLDSEITNVYSIDNVSSIDNIDQQSTSLDSDDFPDFFSPVRYNRTSPVLFAANIQQSPNYFLSVEFFKPQLSASLFKNLTNPPLYKPWFEQLVIKNNSSRISAWKDGNFLYAKKITYHS